MKKRGLFVMLDGLDGIGKGKAEEGILEFLADQGMKLFNQIEFEKQNNFRPDYKDNASKYFVDIKEFDAFYLCEPSYCGAGIDVRNEVIASKNKGVYSARETLEAYSLNRLIHYKRCVAPLLKAGKHIVQSRGLPSTICYQRLQADEERKPLSIPEIISYSGNNLALYEYPPNLLIIPTINNVDELEKRLKNRDKKDDTFLESLGFQKKLKHYFEGNILKRAFELRGTTVTYIDAGISIEETQRQAVDAIKPFFAEYDRFSLKPSEARYIKRLIKSSNQGKNSKLKNFPLGGIIKNLKDYKK